MTGSPSGASLKSEPDLPPWVEKVKRKELRRYREAQGKKWQNWFEAMFEPKR